MIRIRSPSGLVEILEIKNGVFNVEKKPGFENLGRNKFGDDRCFQDLFEVVMILYNLIEERERLIERFECDEYVSLALITPLINAEKHGNKYDPEKITQVRYQLSQSKSGIYFIVEIEDQGSGFDYKHLREMEKRARGTYSTYNAFRINNNPDSVGWGLFNLLREIDEIEWNAIGNRVIIKKRLTLLQS